MLFQTPTSGFLCLKSFCSVVWAPEALDQAEWLRLRLAKCLFLHIQLLTIDNRPLKMQSHSAICALEHRTASLAGSFHCSTPAPFMGLWELAFRDLSNLSP